MFAFNKHAPPRKHHSGICDVPQFLYDMCIHMCNVADPDVRQEVFIQNPNLLLDAFIRAAWRIQTLPIAHPVLLLSTQNALAGTYVPLVA